MRRQALPTVGALVALLLLQASLAASVSATSTDLTAGPNDIESIAGMPAVEGVVRSRDGRARKDASIALYAWPNDTVLAEMRPGDAVNLIPVANTRSDSQGRYQLRIPSDVQLSGSAVSPEDDVADFTVVAVSAGESGSHSFSRRVAANGHGESYIDPSEGTSDAAVADIGLNGSGEFHGEEDPAEARTDEASVVMKKAGCTSTLVSDYGIVSKVVGQVYVATSGVKATWTFLSGASSTIGVGSSSSGAFGTFSQGGTTTKASTDEVGFPTQSVSGSYKLFSTYYLWSKYRLRCNLSTFWWTEYEARPRYFAGGAKVTSTSVPSATYCVPQPAGSSHTKTTTKAVTWSNGVNSSPIIGISLSVQTGHTTTAKIHHAFTQSRKLCGTHDYPASTPVRLVAKS